MSNSTHGAQLTCIVAHDDALGIAKDGRIPWHIPKDLEHFARVTRGLFTPYGKALSNAPLNAVIMGRKTWESLPDKYRPLPVRVNIVLTGKCEYIGFNGDAMICKSVKDVLSLLQSLEHGEAFVIGGEEVYRQFLPYVTKLHVTRLPGDYSCDRFFPEYTGDFALQEKESADVPDGQPLSWEVWIRKSETRCIAS
jgi:dihydrofolate reductase